MNDVKFTCCGIEPHKVFLLILILQPDVEILVFISTTPVVNDMAYLSNYSNYINDCTFSYHIK